MLVKCGTVNGQEVWRRTGTDRYYLRERVEQGEDGSVHDLHRRRPIGRFGSCESAMRHVRMGLAR